MGVAAFSSLLLCLKTPAYEGVNPIYIIRLSYVGAQIPDCSGIAGMREMREMRATRRKGVQQP
jgi:hypothetical protein